MKRNYEGWLCYSVVAALGFAASNSSYGQAVGRNPAAVNAPTAQVPVKTFPGEPVPEGVAGGQGGTNAPGQYGAPGAPPPYLGAGSNSAGTPGAAGAGQPGSAGPAPGAPPAAGAGTPGGDAALGALAGDVAADLGGDVAPGAGQSNTPFMIGDQGPFSIRQAVRFPNFPPPYPPGRPIPGSSPFSKLNHSVNAIVPAVRGVKIADNQSPRPMDRVFVDFNYYDNVNSALNRRLGAPINNMQAFHELFGVEKTFLDGNASLGLRMPVNSLAVNSSYPSLGGTHSGFGNLGVFGKYVLYQDKTGNLVSAGLSVDTPTGPASFGGFPVRYAQNAVGIQPFVGYILKGGDRLFVQGFGAVDVPTVSAMPTMMYLDAGIGYYLYRSQGPGILTAIIPTYELHLNIPLNHRGYSNTDFYAVPDVLDMTFGVNFGLFNTSYLTAAYILPVTGPQPFSGEFALQFNYLFGRSRRAGLGRLTPPVTGG